MLARPSLRPSWRTLAAATATAAVIAAPAPAGAAVDAAASPKRERLSNERTRTYWSYVERTVSVRVRPGTKARRVGRVSRTTWYGLPEVVLVLARERGWSQIRYAGIGSRTGWVPTRTLGEANLERTQVVIDRGRRRLTVYRQGKTVFRAPVGVGAKGSPTPGGRFYIRERLIPANRNGIYGVLALGLSSYSRHRTDWPGGGQVGIHGTNQPRLIPGRISNGCIRLRNADVRRLDRYVGVGTPVRVR